MTMAIIIGLFVGYFTSGVVASALVWKVGRGRYERKELTDVMVLSFMLGYFSLLGLGMLALAKALVTVVQENFDVDKFLESAKDAAKDIQERTKDE